MIIVDRQDIATKLRDLINGVIGPNAENLVEVVLDYLPVSPEGLSPLVAVAPLRSDPKQLTAAQLSETHDMIIYVFVLYTHTARQIDEREAWVALNLIHKRIVETLMLHKKVDGLWANLKIGPGGNIMPMKIDDQGYLLEPIPLEVFGIY